MSDVDVRIRTRPVARADQLPNVTDVQLQVTLADHPGPDISPLRLDCGLLDVKDHLKFGTEIIKQL